MAKAVWIKTNVLISPVKMGDIVSMKILEPAIAVNALMDFGVKTVNLSKKDRH